MGIESLRVSRPVDLPSKKLGAFADKMGRSIEGVGTIYTPGSMSVTLMRGYDFLGIINSLTIKDQRAFRPKFLDFEETLKEKLSDCQETINFATTALGFYASSQNKIRNGKTAVALKGNEDENRHLNYELGLIREVFSEFNLPSPQLLPRKLHLTIGEVAMNRLTHGEGRNPNALVPSGIEIPLLVRLGEVNCKPIQPTH